MRAAIVLSLMLVVPTAASAQVAVSETPWGYPRILDVWRPGVYSVATAGSSTTVGASELYRDGGSTGLLESDSVFGTFLSGNCFIGVEQFGWIISEFDCRPDGNIVPDNPTDDLLGVRRVKHTASGRGYAAVEFREVKLQLLVADAGVMTPFAWRPLLTDPILRPTAVMSVVEMDGGVPHALFGTTRGSRWEFLWFAGDRQQAPIAIPPALTDKPMETVDLVAGEGPHPAALFGNADGLFRAQLNPAGTTLRRVELPGTEPLTILAVDVNTGKGSVHGEGFGLAVGTNPGGDLVVLGAVPADSAADAGTVWRVHPAFKDLALPPELPEAEGNTEVACVDSTYCVITLGRLSGNIVTYTNASAPVLDAGTPSLVLDEGEVHRFLSSASDPDLDAVRLSLDASTARGVLRVDTDAGVDIDTGTELLDVRLTALEVCQEEARELTVVASDGLGAHDRDAGFRVTVINVYGPGEPIVTPASDATSASGTPLDFTATRGAGPCEPVAYEWGAGQPEEPDQPAAPALEVDGATATFVPPDTLCWPEPVQYTYTVRGQDQGRLWSDATSFTVRVTPWGPPLAPFGQGAERRLESGPDAGVDVVPEARHACFATAKRPTVETEWQLSTPGTAVPEGLIVKGADGGTVSLDSPVKSESLRVEAAECTDASLSLTARNRVPNNDEGAQLGPAATVQVLVTPPLEDPAAAALNLSVAPPDAGQVDVTVSTSLRCPRLYSLQAQLSLRDSDGGTLDDARVDVPGRWSTSLTESCAAATYVIEGQLFSGDTEVTTTRTSVSVPGIEAKLGHLEGEALVARCGEAVTATLTQTIPPDACRAVALSWEQVDGPELVNRTLSGESVTVATSDVGLEKLVGQTLRLRVTATASASNSATTVHEVPITTEPFVDVRHETESPTGSEKGLVGVVVRLRNTSECRVGNLRHVERMDGLEWVPGSVKVDGQPVVEQAVEGGFAVDGVTLEARATGTLTYVARPRLLTAPRYGGEVFLNTVLVSGSVPPAPTSGCGCSGGGSSAAVFGLVALARLLRRRRHGTPGAPR